MTRLQERSGALPREGFQSTWVLAAIFFLLAAGIFSGGYFYYRHYERQFGAEAGRQLSAIADLKVGELTQWRR